MQSLVIIYFVLSGVFQLPTYSDQVNNDPAEEVEKVIMEFFDAMRNSEAGGMETFLTADATLKTVATSGADSTILRETNIRSFLNSVSESQPGSLDEQIVSFTSHVDGNLSTAWMEYRFYYNGEFSHCGVNTMNLIHTETGWKIFSIVDTRHQDSC